MGDEVMTTLRPQIKTLVLGCVSTWAKFTPNNHRLTGDPILDGIRTGTTIRTSELSSSAEAEAIYKMGCRYCCLSHDRNPLTHEQTTDNEICRRISREVRRRCGDMLIGCGAGRIGDEVGDRIRHYGAGECVSRRAIPLQRGGAHGVIAQGPVQLHVIRDRGRTFGDVSLDDVASRAYLKAIVDREPSGHEQDAQPQTHTTSKGADDGKASPMVQFQAYANVVRARRQSGLFHEVAWARQNRSHAMARYAVERPEIRPGGSGQLTVIPLLGFSPRLSSPEAYEEVREVAEAAKCLEYDLAEPGGVSQQVAISVGAAVLSRQAGEHVKVRDVGPRRGAKIGVLHRLAACAAQRDTQGDIVRVGMGDTPGTVDGQDRVRRAGQVRLLGDAVEVLTANSAGTEFDHDVLFERGLSRVHIAVSPAQRRRPLGQALAGRPERVGVG